MLDTASDQPGRRRAFLRDLTAAMRLLEAPPGMGERWCSAPQWEQDRARAQLWCDPTFVAHFSIEDYPELDAPIRASIVALVKSFLRATQALDSAGEVSAQDRGLASTHLGSIIERMRPVLEAHWADGARRNQLI